jgi:hypothetical protein
LLQQTTQHHPISSILRHSLYAIIDAMRFSIMREESEKNSELTFAGIPCPAFKAKNGVSLPPAATEHAITPQDADCIVEWQPGCDNTNHQTSFQKVLAQADNLKEAFKVGPGKSSLLTVCVWCRWQRLLSFALAWCDNTIGPYMQTRPQKRFLVFFSQKPFF